MVFLMVSLFHETSSPLQIKDDFFPHLLELRRLMNTMLAVGCCVRPFGSLQAPEALVFVFSFSSRFSWIESCSFFHELRLFLALYDILGRLNQPLPNFLLASF